MNREEHMAWCKQRALAYVDRGEPEEGLTSMFSDLGKHPETQNHAAIGLGVILMAAGSINSPHEARKFIEGFH